MANGAPICGKCSVRIPDDSPHIVKVSPSGERTEYHWDCGERAYADSLGVEQGLRWLSNRRYLSSKQLTLWKGYGLGN